MLVIGERINASSKSVAEVIARRDRDYVAELAGTQASSGDKILLSGRQDCNATEQHFLRSAQLETGQPGFY